MEKNQNKYWEMKMSADCKLGDIFIYGEIVTYMWDEYPDYCS